MWQKDGDQAWTHMSDRFFAGAATERFRLLLALRMPFIFLLPRGDTLLSCLYVSFRSNHVLQQIWTRPGKCFPESVAAFKLRCTPITSWHGSFSAQACVAAYGDGNVSHSSAGWKTAESWCALAMSALTTGACYLLHKIRNAAWLCKGACLCFY